SPDGMRHIFYIRKGVKFHDGSDLTGADVKFSIERMLAPEVTSTDGPVWRAAVASVVLQDDYTVVVNLKSVRWELIGGTGLEAVTGVVPKKYIEQIGVEAWRKAPIGSGPFKVLSYSLGNRLELQAVESHWRAVPKFNNITVLGVPEEGTRKSMLKTGELDMASVTPDSVSDLKSAGLRIVSYDGGSQAFAFAMYDSKQPEKSVYGDVRLRKALQLATDSKEIAEKLLGGNGAPFALADLDKRAYFFDPNVLKPDPYDPEGAKKLLAEAGYPGGFTTKIWDQGGILSTMSLAISGYWRKIGVTAEVVPIVYGTVATKMKTRNPEVWNAYFPVIGTMARDFEKMASGYHYTKGASGGTYNPKLDELIDQVPAIKDPAERKKAALEAAVMAKNEYSILNITGVNLIIAVGPKVGDVVRYPGVDISKYMFETITHAK
ncbi:MAG: ABC transporter substrate-binding protein, partial [Dehalococcoidia bacterium]|nr:ABC transporter substrate-binding protein [Dehalococcoidia bacterium]